MKIKKQKIVFGLLFSIIFLSCCKKQKTFLAEKSVIKENNRLTGNITIFVHGTHTATMNRIFKPFIGVPNRIVKVSSLSNRHYMCNIANVLSHTGSEFPWQDFYAYGWSGILCPKEREMAAENLYSEIKKLILEYKKQSLDPKITIVTHSHGGNVALNLAKFKEVDSFLIDRLILLAVPVQKMTSKFVEDSLFNKIYSFSSSLDLLQVGDPQALYSASKIDDKKCPFFSKRFFKPTKNLRQVKVKINNRAIFHVEFVMERFIKFIPDLIKQMDLLDESLYLVKLANGRDIKVIKCS